jgi:hypothetical protein
MRISLGVTIVASSLAMWTIRLLLGCCLTNTGHVIEREFGEAHRIQLTAVNTPKNDQRQLAPHVIVAIDLSGSGPANVVECGAHRRHDFGRIDAIRCD